MKQLVANIFRARVERPLLLERLELGVFVGHSSSKTAGRVVNIIMLVLDPCQAVFACQLLWLSRINS